MSIKTSYTGISPEDLNLINDYIDSVEKYVLKRYPAHIAQQIIKEERMFIFDDIDLSDTLGKEPDVPFIVGRRKELLNDHLSRYNDNEIVFILPPVLKWISNLFLAIFDLILIFFIWLATLIGGKEKAKNNKNKESSNNSNGFASNNQQDTVVSNEKIGDNTPINQSKQNTNVSHKESVRKEYQEQRIVNQPKKKSLFSRLFGVFRSKQFDYSSFFDNLDQSGRFWLKIDVEEYKKLTSFRKKFFSFKILLMYLIIGFSLVFYIESQKWTAGWNIFLRETGFGRYITRETNFYQISAFILMLGLSTILFLIYFVRLFDYNYWWHSRKLVELWTLYAVPVTYSQVIKEFPGLKPKNNLEYFRKLVYRGIIKLQPLEDH